MTRHPFIKLTSIALLLVGAGVPTHASAQESDALRPLQVEDYFAPKDVNDPRISLDGAWVAYAVGSQDLEIDRSETWVWMVSTSGGEAIPMTATDSPAWRPRWSSDGRYLAFLAERESEQASGRVGAQVFTLANCHAWGIKDAEDVLVTALWSARTHTPWHQATEL